MRSNSSIHRGSGGKTGTRFPWKSFSAALLAGSLALAQPGHAQDDPAFPVYGKEAAALSGVGRISTQPTRETVSYQTTEKPGSIIIDTGKRSLYFVLENGKAIRYAIGVGREGFEWSGTERVSRKAEWPSWRPPATMRKRQPYLPAFMPGGPENPLGARAIYLGATLYRIHGTVEADSIGQAVSSGCIRMLNEDVIDLYERVQLGARVTVS